MHGKSSQSVLAHRGCTVRLTNYICPLSLFISNSCDWKEKACSGHMGANPQLDLQYLFALCSVNAVFWMGTRGTLYIYVNFFIFYFLCMSDDSVLFNINAVPVSPTDFDWICIYLPSSVHILVYQNTIIPNNKCNCVQGVFN